MNTSPQTAPGDAIPLSRHNGLPPLADKAQASMKIIEHDGIFEKTALAVRVSERLRQMSPGALCAAYMIDIDNFRFVNRTLGRAVGDLVLQRTARLLRARFFSAGLAGRLADDVFLAVRFDVASEEDARRTAAELCDALRYTVTEPAPFTTSASIGLHVTAGAESCFENHPDRAVPR